MACPVCGSICSHSTDLHGHCEYCGWVDSVVADWNPDDPSNPNPISLNDYRRLYKEIYNKMRRQGLWYRWIDLEKEWNEFIDDNAQQIRAADKYPEVDVLARKMASFPQKSVSLIASRPQAAIDSFLFRVILSGIMRGRRIDYFDLYHDSQSRAFRSVLAGSDLFTYDSIKHAKDLYPELCWIEDPDLIILYGIQGIQRHPFSCSGTSKKARRYDRFEMTGIMRDIRKFADEKNAAVIVYSGLPRECDVHPVTIGHLHKLYINEDELDYIVALENNCPIVLKDLNRHS